MFILDPRLGRIAWPGLAKDDFTHPANQGSLGNGCGLIPGQNFMQTCGAEAQNWQAQKKDEGMAARAGRKKPRYC